MAEQTNNVVQGFVEGFANNLKDEKVQGHDVNQPRQILVDAFIEETEIEDELRALIRRVATSPKASDALDERLSKLRVTIAAFDKAFPQISKESPGSSAFSWRSLSQTVLRLKSQYDLRYENGVYGKSKRGFHSICGKINDHMNVFKILPQGEKFVAPICGSLELIVKASVTHEHVGEEFGAALQEINDIVRIVRKELSLCQDMDVTGWAIELCCHIIEFLACPLQWYTQNSTKRFRDSLNEHLTEKYTERIKHIRQLSKLIKRSLDLQTAKRIHGIEEVLPSLSTMLQEARVHYQKYYQWTEELPAKQMTALEQHRKVLMSNQDELFLKMSQLLEHNKVGVLFRPLANGEVSRFFEEEQATDMSGPVIRVQQECYRSFGSRPHSGQFFETGREVVAASEALDAYFDLDQIKPEVLTENIFIEGRVARTLQSWTANKSATVLGIIGPATAPNRDPTRMLISNYIRAAENAGILCISYFCNTSHEDPPVGRSRETVGLAQLMYALLKQLVGYLPAQLPHGHSLGQDRFDALDGTLRTWPEALTLFEELIAMASPPYLLFAIHGIEQVEDVYTSEPLESLMAALRRLLEDEAKGLKLKVLFATCGHSQLLGQCLHGDEICDISSSSTARRPGKSGKGRRRIADVAFDGE